MTTPTDQLAADLREFKLDLAGYGYGNDVMVRRDIAIRVMLALESSQARERVLRAALEELRVASNNAVFGSHGNAFLPGQLARFAKASEAARTALAAIAKVVG